MFSYTERAYRDGFHGREPASACTSYLAAYSDGLRDGDRTRARMVARSQPANASPALSGLVSDPSGEMGGGEAALSPSPETPEAQ